MIKYSSAPVQIINGKPREISSVTKSGRDKTLAYSIFNAHNRSNGEGFKISFDAMTSHDITYVSIIQTAKASGMERFPLPYALTNCHNSLCAVGGTINEDDHAFGLSAAKKYGGIYVPANQAVIHQYAREQLCQGGGMILGSDSHTRYGSYGCMGVGEGGGELVKQLLENTWDIQYPEVVLVWLDGKPRRGIGPHDIALSLVEKTFPKALVKNKVLEFGGGGIKNLSADFRSGIDVMTTETSCLSSIWETDDIIKSYYENHGRKEAFKELKIQNGAEYDAVIYIDLDKIESMIALPFHPSRAISIHEFQNNTDKYLEEISEECVTLFGKKPDLSSWKTDKGIYAEQGIIVGCSGGMLENIAEAAAIVKGGSVGSSYFDFSVYPSSQPVAYELFRHGISNDLMDAGAVIKPSFCGPCFGAGDTPRSMSLSIRHATRNFPSREGSKPQNGQLGFTALMDARSIAATAKNGGILTAATDIDYEIPEFKFEYNPRLYESRVYCGFEKGDINSGLIYGPNIKDWPKIPEFEENLKIRLCAVIHDEVTTTDELIPSGETSSYRSNPLGLAEFALSRRVPEYVSLSKKVRDSLEEIPADTSLVSGIFARKPGDGSAREQAASCQKVLGGGANIAYEYATKRYRSNCINWGIFPFTIDKSEDFKGEVGDEIFVANAKSRLLSGETDFPARLISAKTGEELDITLRIDPMTAEEKDSLISGCLMNYYAKGRAKDE
ncbi:hydratase [Clostridiaceae bacterium OttesenSCG-928-D20]|nr:hydratase [Clostridiaceae bacterium OttesenSCG-928-D20]